MSISAAIRRQVEVRANSRCEYCRMHQSLQGAVFHIEHIVPTADGGRSELDNLALACPGCNFRKSDRVFAIDSDSSLRVRIFNPRVDRWAEHFRWVDYQIVGQTPTGRATVALLDLNHSRRIKIRQAEELFDLFPPDA